VIDRKTGALRFEDGVELSSELTRTSFLASEIGQRAEKSVQNEPYSSWRLSALLDPPHTFSAILYFRGEKLWQICLVDSDPKFGTSWSDSDEHARKLSHDVWLEASLSTERDFAWGSAESLVDVRSGGDATVLVTYR
jgi:hypothetical protein